MTAIITPSLRHDHATSLLTSIATDNYYMGVGRAEAWANELNPSVPNEGSTLLLDARNGIQGMVRLQNASLVIPRWTWEFDATYYSYDDRDTDILVKPFYVITDDYYVYICLRTGAGSSTIKPTGTLTDPFVTADGYTWKFLYEVTTDGFDKYLTNVYMPIQNAPTTDDGSLQWDVQDTAVAGAIHNIVVDQGGSGYSAGSPPTVTITGDGSNATATATVVGGAVSSIAVTDIGSGYTYADVSITDPAGTNASVRAVMSPTGGHGADVVKALGAYFVLINGRIDDSISLGDIIPGQDYRQTIVIKDPVDYGTTNESTAASLNASFTMNLTSDSGFVVDDIIEGSTSGAKAIVDYYDAANHTLRFHQSISTGRTPFDLSENIASSGGTGVINTIIDPDVDVTSGEIIYIENHAPILHTAGVVDDIKLIIQF